MKQKSEQDPKLLLVHVGGTLTILAILAGMWVLTIRPAIERRDAVDALKLANERATHRVNSLELEVSAARRDVAKAAEELESASVRLVSVDARNSRLAEITSLAAGLGLSVDELSPGEPQRGELFSRVPIDMKGRASFPDFARFIHQLHGEFLDTDVSSFRIARSGGDAVYTVRLVWHATPSERIRTGSP